MDMENFFLHSLMQSGITKTLDDDCYLLAGLLSSKAIHANNKQNRYVIAMDSFVENIHFRCIHDSLQMPYHQITCKPISSHASSRYCIHKQIPNLSSVMQHYEYHNHTTQLWRYVMPNQWLSYESLARKAFLVNISDIISSGALPLYALLAITLPHNLQKTSILEIVQGIQSVCKQYGIFVIGGDTTKGDALGFHITLIGKLCSQYLSRKSVQCGDFLAYTSSRKTNIGSSLKTLRNLLRYGATINKIPAHAIESRNRYIRFMNPVLRCNFMVKAKKAIHACMDISDGLANEIRRLESLNSLQFKAFRPIQKEIYQSGEEYELLFSFSPKYLTMLQKIAKLSRIHIHVIGQFGRYKKMHFKTLTWH